MPVQVCAFGCAASRRAASTASPVPPRWPVGSSAGMRPGDRRARSPIATAAPVRLRAARGGAPAPPEAQPRYRLRLPGGVRDDPPAALEGEIACHIEARDQVDLLEDYADRVAPHRRRRRVPEPLDLAPRPGFRPRPRASSPATRCRSGLLPLPDLPVSASVRPAAGRTALDGTWKWPPSTVLRPADLAARRKCATRTRPLVATCARAGYWRATGRERWDERDILERHRHLFESCRGPGSRRSA